MTARVCASSVRGPSTLPDVGGRLVGFAAVVFSALYLLSDVLEVVQGDFTDARLVMTYAGEAAIPLFVLGLYAVQRPHIGRLGLLGAVLYAYAYVFFTTTVVYALVARTRNYDDLSTQFGGWMVVHGAVLVVGGLAFGVAVIRAGVVPRWTGSCLIAGVVAVAAVSGLSNLARTLAAALPAAAFIGMGYAVLTGPGQHPDFASIELGGRSRAGPSSS